MDEKTVGVLVILSGIVGGAATKLFEWITVKSKTSYEQSQQIKKDTLTEYQDLLHRHSTQIERLENKNEVLERANDECEKRNSALERQQERNQARIEYLEEALINAKIPFRRSGDTQTYPVPPTTTKLPPTTESPGS